MRLRITALLYFLSSAVMASSEKSMNELFKKYDQVMDAKKIELIDEVFSKKFLRESGGKEKLASKVKALPVEKNLPETKVSWRKGAKDEIYFARIKPTRKSKQAAQGPEFIIIEEDGKLKIHGTLSDAD
jgi:hypothetical protein